MFSSNQAVRYFHHKKIIEELNFLRNERKKCNFCDKNFCQNCEFFKQLETEL